MPVNWGLDSYVYVRGLSSLNPYLTLVTFDPRGVGLSDPARQPEEFALEQTADDAQAVAEALGITRCIVLGHSSGGAVALTFALRHPERVSHLILLSTSAKGMAPRVPGGPARLPGTEEEMREQVRAAMPRAVHDPGRFRRAMEEILPRMHFSPERLRWTAEVGERAYDVRPRLREIRAPALIVHGREDPVVPRAEAEELHAGLVGSRLLVLDRCGHWPHVERRAEFVAAVREFLGLKDLPR